MAFFDFLSMKLTMGEATCAGAHDETAEVSEAESDLHQFDTLATRMATAYPTPEGLYPHEVLMLSFVTGYRFPVAKFQKFWTRTFWVENPQELLESLMARGFVCEGSVRETLLNQKSLDLQRALKKLGAKMSGSKADLVARLMRLQSPEELRKEFNGCYYGLTEAGKSVHDRYAYIPYVWEEKIDSIWRLNKKLKGKACSISEVNDVLIAEYRRIAHGCYSQSSFLPFRIDFEILLRILDKQRDYHACFDVLVAMIALDLNGLSFVMNGEFQSQEQQRNNLETIQYIGQNNFMGDYSEYARGEMIRKLRSYAKVIGITDEEFVCSVRTLSQTLNLPRKTFNDEETARLLLAMMQKNIAECEAIYRTAKVRLSEIVH